MKSKWLRWTSHGRTTLALIPLAMLGIGVAGLTPGAGFAGEQSRLPESFSGLLNDYTPAAPTVTGSPYEMHGRWSLQLNWERRAAALSVEMTMETADFANSDPEHDPTKLGPHTHHISVTDGVVHDDPTDPINWKTVCPTFKPPVTGGFVVTGTAFVTGNGANAPFGNPSAVTICVLGGMKSATIPGAQAFVEYSNFTLAFKAGSPASSHFGTQAINGVVARCDSPWNRESNACRVAVVE